MKLSFGKYKGCDIKTLSTAYLSALLEKDKGMREWVAEEIRKELQTRQDMKDCNYIVNLFHQRYELIMFENGVFRNARHFDDKADAELFGDKWTRGSKYRSYKVYDTLEPK